MVSPDVFEHLIANLTIEREDFDTLPIFTRDGGWAKANGDFDGDLEEFLRKANAAMAA